jgi:hypothetical protein
MLHRKLDDGQSPKKEHFSKTKEWVSNRYPRIFAAQEQQLICSPQQILSHGWGEENRPLGRPRRKQDNIKTDIKSVEKPLACFI